MNVLFNFENRSPALALVRLFTKVNDCMGLSNVEIEALGQLNGQGKAVILLSSYIV